ncbi:proline/glycine betaine ABC transporter permease [Staphylococcus nepalensis]|uniref:Proline/glycine betaine ABC transporter permease n=2 Tax=Staphylococcus nepalensis TaxID=214473 RepID=A0ABS3L4J2_9STAP|nr:proline/glycine betaine ABC transporter permease [Staphylococcus nepalensis]MBO1228435.1 proline/glycine betaine ABC transporter permease [Staphylococcus nepalensis]MBO1236082.1 proline/glycine betaine ABC transporter permease [Staphylococcus nepalensis]
MFNFNRLAPIPLDEWIETMVEWITNTFSFIFEPIKDYLGAFMRLVTNLLAIIPPYLFIVIIMIVAFIFMKKRITAAVLVGIGLYFIFNQDYWSEFLDTTTLVIISTLLCVIIGIPIGIAMSKSDVFESIAKPILDFMQTMPAFVYLIPAVAFFGIGMVPGVFASIIFATPPTIRLTNLGIRQISTEYNEAADSFGTTPSQKLFKIQLPLAKSSIMAGVNQTVMLALSMVVIASMIGSPGLGREVLSSLQRSEVGTGFVSGLSIVILAIIIDRFTQLSKNKER